MSVHRIRLRGPWRYEWLSKPEPPSAKGRVSLPLEWREIFGLSAGHVRFSRTFHRPTNLEPSSEVDLVFEGIGGEMSLRLNGQGLEMQSVAESEDVFLRYRITEHLQVANELQVDLRFDPNRSSEPGGLWGLVVLEIHE